MQKVLLNYQTKLQIFTVLLLASNISARLSPTTSETTSSLLGTDISQNQIFSSSTNSTSSTSSVDYHDNKKSHIMQSNFVIAAIVFTSFCVLGLFLQHRWKIYMTAKKRDVEDTDHGIDVRMARVNGTDTPNNYQPPRNREDTLYDGLDAQQDAPPPYTLSSKPPGFREGIETTAPTGIVDITNADQEPTSTEPPAYNEHVIYVQNQNVGDMSIARPHND